MDSTARIFTKPKDPPFGLCFLPFTEFFRGNTMGFHWPENMYRKQPLKEKPRTKFPLGRLITMLYQMGESKLNLLEIPGFSTMRKASVSSSKTMVAPTSLFIDPCWQNLNRNVSTWMDVLLFSSVIDHPAIYHIF